MATLSTHILDTANGKPAAGMRVTLHRNGQLLTDLTTNADGRCDGPLLSDEDFQPGLYELRFFVKNYFEDLGTPCPFLDEVPIVFSTQASQSYHVPLLCSPWSYSTYRGS